METSAKQTVTANLLAWMTYAEDHRLPGASVAALSRLSGVSRPTIDDIRAGSAAPAVDTLAKIAKVFGMEAWQLLVPGCVPPQKPALGDAAWIEEEVQRRTRIEVSNILQEMAALHGEGRRDGSSPAKPFTVGPVKTIESSGSLQPDAPGTARRKSAAKSVRKPATKAQKAA